MPKLRISINRFLPKAKANKIKAQKKKNETITFPYSAVFVTDFWGIFAGYN